MSRLSPAAFARQARDLRARFGGDDRAAGVALYVLVRTLADDAQRIRDGVSGDVYVQRALASWDRDMERLRNQQANVMAPALAEGTPATIVADVITPTLDGLWPAWVAALPQYASGVRPMDALLPPTARFVMRGGVRHLETLPVVASVVALWNAANEARGFDASSGDDAPSRSIKRAVTEFASGFEGEAPGDERTWWDGVVEWTGATAEKAADTGSELWEATKGGFGYVVGLAAGGLLVAFALDRFIRR